MTLPTDEVPQLSLLLCTHSAEGKATKCREILA